MPPKPKVIREDIVTAAYELARKKGMEAVSAREVGRRLGTSSSPVFTVYGSMEELKEEVRALAMSKYTQYIVAATDLKPSLERLCTVMVRFAREEPELFKLLFSQGRGEPAGVEDVISEMGSPLLSYVDMIGKEQELSYEEAFTMLRHLWIYCYGISSLCAGGVCSFSDAEISRMISQEIKAMLILIKLAQPLAVEGINE